MNFGELCFVHVPKTAGNSWVRMFIDPDDLVQREVNCYTSTLRDEPRLFFTILGHERRAPGHITLEQHLKRTPHRCLVVAFVRNPFDRLVSAFFHLRRGGLNELDRMDAERYTSQYGDNFALFVRGELGSEAPPALSQIHLRPQIDWLVNAEGNLVVDFLGKFETIETDTYRIASVLDIGVKPMSRLNSSQHAPYYDLYNADSRAIVARTYRHDFDAFGYSTALVRPDGSRSV